MLSDAARSEIYRDLALTDQAIQEIERIRKGGPARKVGKSALTNMVTYLYSPAMGDHLICESRTCEALCFMEQEYSGRALEIYPQREMQRVERFSAGGHRSTTNIICDALMICRNEIVFVECKYRTELKKLARKNPDEWIETEQGWSRPAAERWAQSRGCRYLIWTPPEPHGYALANMEVLFPFLGREIAPSEKRFANHVLRAASDKPIPLITLLEDSEPEALSIIMTLFAQRRLFGTIQSGLISQPESFFIGTDEHRINELTESMLRRIKESLAPITVKDPLHLATKVDYERGKARLARATAIIEGKTPPTRRYQKLVAAVREALRSGTSALAVCLTHYANSGSPDSKLSEPQQNAIEKVFKEYWDTAKSKSVADLHGRLKNLCKQAGIDDVPSKTTLRLRLKRRSQAKHDLANAGNRGYHANKPVSDPSIRSIRAIAPFTVAHVDATKFDHRSAAATCPGYPFSCPVLYSSIDGATGEILGRSLTFGPPSRFGLALLFRDIVFRHGRFPMAIIADRGSEMWSEMIIAFAAHYQITLYMRPAGAGRFGSQIENALREINTNVAHLLIGSTQPDMQGRAVDGKMKSYRTARLDFGSVVSTLDHVLFKLWPDRPIGELGGSPNELKAQLATFGDGGRHIARDDDFLLATSVPIKKYKARSTGTLRIRYREYASEELTLALRRHGSPKQVRLDCTDPSRVYVRCGPTWIRAHSTSSLSLAVSTELDRIFDGVFTRDRARANRLAKEKFRAEVLDRVDHTNASAPATKDVQPAAAPTDPEENTSIKPNDLSLWQFDSSETPLCEEVER